MQANGSSLQDGAGIFLKITFNDVVFYTIKLPTQLLQYSLM